MPDPEDPHGPLPSLMVALTVVSGLVDAFSYLALGHVFVANMTGNVVFIAFAVTGSPGFSLAAAAAALVAFAVGSLLGGRIARRWTHRGRQLLAVSSVQTGLMLAALLFALLAPRALVGFGRYLLIALSGLGMGMQNAGARRIGVPDLTTTVLTMTITGLSADNRLAGGQNGRVGRRLMSVLSLFFGALVGGLVFWHSNPAWTLLLAVLVLALITAVSVRLARSSAGWTSLG
jgi:uncharacterized membrane protein YoaK (UPF0700 family)